LLLEDEWSGVHGIAAQKADSSWQIDCFSLAKPPQITLSTYAY
jgi:hypothetical protein